jgi:hypothetical protein
MTGLSRFRAPAPAFFSWAALLCYFPLLLLLAPEDGTPAGLAVRVALFHGVGTAWSAMLLARQGRPAGLRPLFRRPWSGMATGVCAFVLAGGAWTLFLWRCALC